MSNTWTDGDLIFSHGPDQNIGGPRCPEHHSGTRTGINDGCCCCDPCRYLRPPGSSGEFLIRGCCRCVPRLLCITFTPDVDADACCRANSIAVPPVFSDGGAIAWDYRTTYTGDINGIDLTITIFRKTEDGPCFWSIESDGGYIYEETEIDHVDSTCLDLPSITIAGVTDSSGCVGTLTFGASEMEKIPYRRDAVQAPLTMFTPTWQGGEAQCNCTQVPQYLCVEGVRHRGEAREQVQFTWDEDLGDRWSYLPCDGNISTDQEHIYLRGDAYGNCYLEFDFEQSGDTTNDWAVPPNTLGEDVHEIRDGMVAIESCGCDLYAYSAVDEVETIEFPTSRFVYITAGVCGCWRYICGTCRCAPRRVCVLGMIDGEPIIADGIWDGTDSWMVDADGYAPAIQLRLTGNDCGDCVIQPEGDFDVPFAVSDALTCGEAMTAECFSEFDEYFPQTFNWLWVTAAPCDCLVSPCFLCLEERCGGMPEVIYYSIETRVLPGFPLVDYEEFCNITIPLYYFKRFFGVSRQVICGYIGYATVSCDATESRDAFTRIIRVSVLSGGPGAFNYEVDMAELESPPAPLVWSPVFGATTRPDADIISCDPFVADTGWFSMPVNCRWGCADIPSSTQPTQMREMFTE